MTLNPDHQDLLQEIKQLAKEAPFKTEQGANYAGHTDQSYELSHPQLRTIAKTWTKKHHNIKLAAYVKLLNSIYHESETSTEKYLGGYLLEYMPNLRKELDPSWLDQWLENLEGWAQIDSLCQSKFNADDLLNNWQNWKKTIKKFNHSPNLSKKRASLVLLTQPVRESEDGKLMRLAFENIEKLKEEPDKLITKAISWLLREMIKLHRQEVRVYLEHNKDTLPSIVVRETTNKLKTGRK